MQTTNTTTYTIRYRCAGEWLEQTASNCFIAGDVVDRLIETGGADTIEVLSDGPTIHYTLTANN